MRYEQFKYFLCYKQKQTYSMFLLSGPSLGATGEQDIFRENTKYSRMLSDQKHFYTFEKKCGLNWLNILLFMA